MSEQQRTEERSDRAVGLGSGGEFWPGWETFWESRAGLGAALLALMLVGGVLLFGKLGSLGIWEPWEAGDILVAQEYQDRPEPEPLSERDPKAPSYNWAVPTRDQKPVNRSLLKTWLVSASMVDGGEDSDSVPVGDLEFSSRAPLAAAILIVAVLGLFWLRRLYGTWAALLVSLAFVSTPAIYLGVHNVAAEMLFVATTTAAIMAFVALMYAEGATRYLWGALFGVALGLAFMDQRLLGLLIPLASIAGFGVTQIPYLRAARAGEEAGGEVTFLGWPQIAGCVAMLAGAGGTLLWGYLRSQGAVGPDATFLPHIRQIMVAAVPLWIVAAGLALAWSTRVVRSLRGPAGLLGIGIATAIIVGVLEAYADANPTLLKNGEVFGTIPVLTYSLENTFYGSGFLTEHVHFAMWIRQIGFSMLPWAALAPLGAGYLARSTRLTGEQGGLRDGIISPGESVKRLFLVWAFLSVVLMGVGSMYGHFFYPAYFPLAAGAALMLADADFWREIRVKTLLPYAMGFAAIAVVMMLGKDLERFPARFVEIFAMFQEDVGLPDSFGYGSVMKGMKYGWMLMLATFFFGVVSWAVLTLRNARKHLRVTLHLIEGAAMLALAGYALRIFVLRGLHWLVWACVAGAALLALHLAFVIFTRRADIAEWFRNWGSDQDTYGGEGQSMARQRAVAKEELRRQPVPGGLLARLAETARTGGAIIALVFVASAGIFLYGFAPDLGNHLSQRGVFEAYTQLRGEGESLKRYQVSTTDTSVYLRGVDSVPNRAAFLDLFEQDERVFVVVRRDELSSLNKHVRKRYERNIPVLDARSSQLLLVSNVLEAGEEDQNFVAEAIVEDPGEIEHDSRFPKDGEQVHAVFDNRLELLGYSLDHEGDIPAYGWGQTAELSMYFKVLKPVPASYQMFMHVDYPGSRIHGDHYPVNGDFPTNDWLVGDIVKDVYELKIDPYSSTGVYTIYMGFYRGSNRMQVQPPSAHDGENRVPMGKIRVTGF